MEKFLAWIRRTLLSLQGFTSSLITKKQSPELYSYDSVPFKLYISIAGGKSLKDLVIKGKVTNEQLAEAWEQIVKRNSSHNGSYQYGSYFQLLQAYELLINEYQMIKAMLTKLSIKVDAETINDLKQKRFFINTKSSALYEESLLAAGRKVENLVTKIRMKQNEMRELENKGGKDEMRVGFEELMANLSMGLGFSVEDNITLARYNEYQKLLKKKVELSKANKNG